MRTTSSVHPFVLSGQGVGLYTPLYLFVLACFMIIILIYVRYLHLFLFFYRRTENTNCRGLLNDRTNRTKVVNLFRLTHACNTDCQRRKCWSQSGFIDVSRPYRRTKRRNLKALNDKIASLEESNVFPEWRKSSNSTQEQPDFEFNLYSRFRDLTNYIYQCPQSSRKRKLLCLISSWPSE